MLHPRETDSVLSRELRFWDPLGGRQEFSLVTFGRAMIHPKFLVFGGLTLLLFFATDPSGNRPYVPLWVNAGLWPVAYVMYISLYALLLLCLSVLSKTWTSIRVPITLVGLVALAPTVYVSEFIILEPMSGGTYAPNMRDNYLFYFLAVQVIEALFYKFIFPGIKADLGLTSTDSTPQPKPEEKVVTIGGTQLNLRAIHFIEAREHHVHVTCAAAERRLRARLSDIVAQTTDDDGVQTHRSWWVARHVVKELHEQNGKSALELSNGRRIPVARTRIKAVREWTDTHVREPSIQQTAAE